MCGGGGGGGGKRDLPESDKSFTLLETKKKGEEENIYNTSLSKRRRKPLEEPLSHLPPYFCVCLFSGLQLF